jgi:hypothetical protein
MRVRGEKQRQPRPRPAAPVQYYSVDTRPQAPPAPAPGQVGTVSKTGLRLCSGVEGWRYGAEEDLRARRWEAAATDYEMSKGGWTPLVAEFESQPGPGGVAVLNRPGMRGQLGPLSY